MILTLLLPTGEAARTAISELRAVGLRPTGAQGVWKAGPLPWRVFVEVPVDMLGRDPQEQAYSQVVNIAWQNHGQVEGTTRADTLL